MYDPAAPSFPALPGDSEKSQTRPDTDLSAAPVPLWSSLVAYAPGDVVFSEGTYWRCEVEPFRAATAPPGRQLHIWTPISSTLPAGLTAQDVQQPPPWSPPSGPSRSRRRRQAESRDDDRGGPNLLNGHSSGPSVPSGSSKAGIIAPVPLSASNMLSHDASLRRGSAESHDSDSSPDSQTTVTARKTKTVSSYDHDDDDEKHHLHAQAQAQAEAESQPQTQTEGRHRTMGTAMSTAQFFSSKADESLRFLTARQEVGKARDPAQWEEELKGKRVWRIGGLGVWAHDLDPEVEGRKAELWKEWSGPREMGRGAWIQTAQDRTSFYNNTRGIKPLVIWKLVQPNTPFAFPPDALQIGHDGSGQPLFSARAWHEGGLQLGKAGPHLNRGCSISYGGAEIQTDTYEVLCAARPDPALLKWMCFNHGEEMRVEGWQPVEGGRERDGQSLFVAKGEWEGGQHPGKCRVGEDYAHIGWGGGEVWIRPFYVLAYATSTRR